MKHRFDIIYAPQTKQHLKTIQRKYQTHIAVQQHCCQQVDWKRENLPKTGEI